MGCGRAGAGVDPSVRCIKHRHDLAFERDFECFDMDSFTWRMQELYGVRVIVWRRIHGWQLYRASNDMKSGYIIEICSECNDSKKNPWYGIGT